MHNIWTWRRFSPQWKKAIIRIRSLNILCDHLTWWTLSNRVVDPLLAPWEVIHPGVYCPTDAGHSVSVLKDMVTAPPDIKCGQKKEKRFNPVRINNRIQNQTTTLKKKKKKTTHLKCIFKYVDHSTDHTYQSYSSGHKVTYSKISVWSVLSASESFEIWPN